MSKKTAFTFCFCAISAIAFSQPKNDARCPVPIKRNAGVMSVIDTTLVCVWYAFNADNLKDEDTYIDLQRLEIGKEVTKYYSYFIFQSDSLRLEWIKANPKANSIPSSFNYRGKKNRRWSEYQHSDLFIANGVLTEYATMPMWLTKYNSYYREPYPLQKWVIENERQLILDYKCQKATCHWRGRDFVAWFTTDIPTKGGPWKFGGLPGLILKLHDSDNLYRFEAVQVSAKKEPIYKYDFKEYFRSDRKKVWAYQVKFNENWYKAVNYRPLTPDASGNFVVGEPYSKHTPYEPLEKE